jgi:transcriptional regulator with XRE-family HTH domain
MKTQTHWITKRREQLRINQDELAARLQLAGFDFTRGSISHWENGRHEPPLQNPEFRKALADALKMSVPSLLVAAGYEITARHSENAMRAADIVDQMPDDKQELALGILEHILRGA